MSCTTISSPMAAFGRMRKVPCCQLTMAKSPLRLASRKRTAVFARLKAWNARDVRCDVAERASEQAHRDLPRSGRAAPGFLHIESGARPDFTFVPHSGRSQRSARGRSPCAARVIWERDMRMQGCSCGLRDTRRRGKQKNCDNHQKTAAILAAFFQSTSSTPVATARSLLRVVMYSVRSTGKRGARELQIEFDHIGEKAGDRRRRDSDIAIAGRRAGSAERVGKSGIESCAVDADARGGRAGDGP